MKRKLKLLLVLLVLFANTGKYSLVTGQTLLPMEPWRAIVFMERNSPGIRWEGDVTIKLFGNYSKRDSVLLENSIELFNKSCETINLKMTPYERGKLEIYFIDSINVKHFQGIVPVPTAFIGPSWSYNYSGNKVINRLSLGVRSDTLMGNKRQNYLTNILALALYPKILSSDYLYLKGRIVYERPLSIFNSVVFKPEYKPDYGGDFSEFDLKLLKAVYGSDFKDLLSKAISKYDSVPQWVRENAYVVLVFPLVIAIFIATVLIIYLYRRFLFAIKNKFLRFNLVSILSILIASLLGLIYVDLSGGLNDPHFNFYNKLEVAPFLLIVCGIGLVFANLIRFVEILIHRNTRRKYIKILLLFVSTSLIPSLAVFSFVYFAFKKDLDSEGIAAMFYISMGFVGIGIIRALISFFIMKEKEIKNESQVQLAKLRELKTKAELNALHSKINPHFLYNSLNSIAGLAKMDANKTEQMALSLSKLFRYSINKEQSDWTTIKEEIEMVKIYLEVEKVRFEDRLDFAISLSEDLNDEKIPRFIIQPLVENAIKHGISKNVEEGFVDISVNKINEQLEIKIVDNGPDFPSDLAPGFGLQGINDKLEILYPNKFEIHTFNSPEKYISIKLSN